MTRILISALAITALSLPAWAGDPPKGEPSRETRRELAGAHRKMAECLESERPFTECHDELMKACHSKMGEEGCPMMGHGGMHGHGMKPPAPSGEHSAK